MNTDTSIPPHIHIVGCGRAGSSLAVTFARRGCAVSATDRRKARSRLLATRFAISMYPSGPIDLLVLAVPDAAIEEAATEWAARGIPPAAAVHLGGATPSEALTPLARLGWRTAKMHPVFAFPARPASLPPGVAFGLGAPDAAGLKMARQWVRRLEGRPFALRPGSDAVWHLACVVAGNFLHAQLHAAETLMKEAVALSSQDVRRVLAPLLLSSFENTTHAGGAAALTGPVARSDVHTIALHLTLLSRQHPEFSDFYMASTALLLRLLPPARQASLRRQLKRNGLLL